MLLISGSGQNTGKTTLVCQIIREFAAQVNLTGIKITNHFHPLTYEMPVLAEHASYKIYREILKDQPKDSSRMLTAGAAQVFFVMAEKEYLKPMMVTLLNSLDEKTALICESGGIADYFKPGLHIHLTDTEVCSIQNIPTGIDLEIKYDGKTFTPNPDRIVFENNIWRLNYDITRNC